ncbi:YcjF family protein [Castellaniella sp.]|uniref:YcjF family protein n=1 Tax=Castellaniella sp. TaxID=1955812 RepID=UPI002AFDD6AA|nr:TerB family tellurite resistance protein [Castellaniella sp.]
MNTEEVRAILTICLLASYADGDKHDREREQIRQVAQGLAEDQRINLPGLYQEVLMRRVQLADVLPKLSSSQARQLAYEMAVCVCEADGRTSEPEQAFLARLREALGQAPTAFDAQADTLAAAPLGTASVMAATGGDAPHPAALDAPSGTAAQRRPGALSAAEMDSKILNASILNGAIELLPENLSTLAIIPLQMRLVYQIGQSHGYELDRGHIKDLLATLGVGLTSQYLEQAGRKLLGGLLGKVGGGLLGGLGRQAVSSGMSFASTYALGHVAHQYYAGGRALNTQMLRDAYQHVMADGRQMQDRYLPQMQEMSRGLNTARILQMVRGG